MAALAPKHARFVVEYLKDLNATQAAIRSGYHEKSARTIGSRLLAKVDISAAIAKAQGKALEKAELSGVRVLEEMRRLAFSDVRALFDEAGNLKPIHTLPEDVASTIASVEVVKKNLAAGDGQTDTVHKLKVWDKTKALEQLGKHFGLLVERSEVLVTVDVVNRLAAGRKRLSSLPG